jgi:hypothetical protein
MSKNRNILILAVVLVVLLAISLAQKAGHKKSTSRSATVQVVEGTFTADQLGRITLGRGSDAEAVELLAGPTGWVVASAWDTPASQSRIDALLRNLSDLAGEFRSDDASVLADYGLADTSAVLVRAYDKDGEQVIAVDVGGKPERFPGNFVKRPGSNAVYLSQTNLLSQMGLYSDPGIPGNKHFLELQVVQEDRLAVDKVILQDGDQVLEMIKEFAEVLPEPETDGQAAEDQEATRGGAEDEPPALDRSTWEWKLTAPRTKALAKTKADGVLITLVNIRATDVADPTADLASYGLSDPARKATLVREDGSELTVSFGDTKEAEEGAQAGVWMMVDGQPGVWIVSDYSVKNIFKTEEELLPDEE